MASESRLRANAKYDAAHCTGLYLKLNNETDKDILEKLSSVSNRQGYIKNLIRKDIAGTCSELKKEKKEGYKAMKTYMIKPEYLEMWEGGDTPSNPERIITEDDIRTFSVEWDKSVDELLEQLIPVEEEGE